MYIFLLTLFFAYIAGILWYKPLVQLCICLGVHCGEGITTSVPGFATHLKRINLQIAMKRWCSRWTLYLAIIYCCLMNIQGTSWCRPCSFAGSVLSFRFCTSLHLLYFLLRSLPSLSPPPTHTCTQTTPPLFPSISAHNLPANHVQTENVFTGEPENRRELVWFAWQTLSKNVTP